MSNVFVISDTHFGHANILNFKRKDGSPLRVFDNVSQMNDCIITRWNEVVRTNDKVYHLGDVAMDPRYIPLIGNCNGKKRLVIGNHDSSDMRLYSPYFEAIYSSRLLDRMIFTHIPIHPESLGKNKANIHGHCHWTPELCFGPRYLNVSVEMTDYYPVSLEDIKKKVQIQIGETW